jgi:SnoaL-like domain
MPSPAIVEAFVATVETEDYVGAIERFYAADASMRENLDEPRVGRDQLAQRERLVLGQFERIAAERRGPPLISGDHVAIRWHFEFFVAGARIRTLDEIAWQVWHDEQIVEEIFFYDPSQMKG